MKQDIALVIFYNRPNKYSFNALVGALETDNYFKDLTVYFINKEENLLTELETITKSHKKTILGISFFTTQIWDTRRLVKQLKLKFSNKILLIAGGPHPTGDPEGTLKMGFNVVVRGEGEKTLSDLVKSVDQENNWADIKGIAYFKDRHEYHYTGRRQLINLDDYPPFAIMHRKFGPIEITRGCPYVCYFCQTPRLFGTKPRHRSIDKICEYVSTMKSKNLVDIRFISPNAFSYGSDDGKTLNIDKLEHLLKSVRKIIGREGKIFIGSFPSEVRPEHVTGETINLILQFANNDNLVIGGQSGSKRILELCHRGHTVQDIYKSAELTLNANLKANVDFIFGLPGENEHDITETIRVMDDLVKMGAKIHTHTFMPLPQTPFSKSLAGVVDDKTRKMVNKLVSTKLAYGNWVEQEKAAKKIAQYFKQSTTRRKRVN